MNKAAMIHLTKTMAGMLSNGTSMSTGEKAGRHITYNAVAPGPFPGMIDRYFETQKGRDAIGSLTTVGRAGSPEDMGAVCIFLASRAGSFVTGAVIPVDGGVLVGKYANM